MVAIVTGSGGGGCGRAIAQRLARDGAVIVVSDLDEAGGAETVRLVERAGGRATFCRADVRDDTQVQHLVQWTTRTIGPLSVLINNASAPHPTEDGIAGWMNSIATDFLGALSATRYAIDAMRGTGGGSIVNISSISSIWHGRTTDGGFPGYDIAKAALLRMTTALAPMVMNDNIRVNVLAPGWIATDEPRQDWESLTPAERASRGVPATLLTTDQIAGGVSRLALDPALNGRLVIWWSDDKPRLVRWGDRGYREFDEFSI